jgi:argininosuccinate lyase
MLTLSRLAQDMILFAMPEFGYFVLPKECGTGSSIMPQKSNPDVLELVRAKAVKVLGLASTAAGMIQGLPGGYNRDLQEIKDLFMEGMATTRACLRVLTLLVKKLKVDRKALRKGFTPDVFAADRALALVAEGLSFRDAYHHVKAHLGELAEVDPAEALRKKRHLGAPGALNLAGLRARAKAVGRLFGKEKTRFHAAIGKLLGVAYPSLRRR